MARNHHVTAGVFSLVLVGPWAVAQANSRSSTAPEQAVVRILGASLCMPDAPPDAACTWRLPRAPDTDRARHAAALADVKAAIGRVLTRLGFAEQEPTELQARR